MKKWALRALKAVLLLIVLLGLLETGIYLVSRTEWFNTQVTQFLRTSLGRDIQLAHMGANLRGVFIDKIEIAEKEGFEKGTFIKADRLRIRFCWWHLLHGHAKIDLILFSDVTVQATTYENGTTSWQDLLNSSHEDTSSSNESDTASPWRITAGRIRLENLHFIYTDKMAPRTLNVSGLTLDVKHFNLQEEFPLLLQTRLHHQENAVKREIPLVLQARIHLNQLDLEQAYADIKKLQLFADKSSITLSGKIEDFINPKASFNIILHDLSSDLFTGIAEIPPFQLPRAEISLKIATQLAQQALTLHHLKLQAPGITLQAKGGLLYGGPLQYETQAQTTLTLGEIGQWFPLFAENYQLVGTLQNTFSATQQKATAQTSLQNVGGRINENILLSDLNGEINVQGNLDGSHTEGKASLNGKLNAHPFQAHLTADHIPTLIEAAFTLSADEFFIAALPQTSVADEQQETQNSTEQRDWPLPPISLKADIQLGQVDVPYFNGEKVSFTAEMSGLTPNLNQAQGSLHLSTGEGKIQDIYKLTNANPLTKVLFLSLNVTGKVFNSLNVIGVLNGLGSGLVSAVSGTGKESEKTAKTQTILGPDGEPLEVTVENTEKQVSGEMEYDKLDTQVHFEKGVATIKEGIFVSPMMSFRLDGTTDFNAGIVDMHVHAAPGRHEIGGMMPLSLKIGGTIENPQGDMQLLGSVSSLVTQSITNNVVSRQVKKGIKGFFGLFQKKEPEE